jgi:vacuolar-type H+-ATPase subunit I/STV1
MHGQLDRNRKELSTLLADQQEIDKAEKRLSDFDECVSNFKSDFSLLDDRKSQLGSRDLELQKLKESLVTATARFKEAEVNYADSRVAYESREKLLQQSRDLENCARINNRKKAVGVLTERISNGERLSGIPSLPSKA